ncbi:MAG: putative transrane protein [Proteobacteria bacterium]|nr:putative transrane protein [Pseudomonadota bacterium]
MNSVAIHSLPNQRQGRLMLALIVALLALPFVIGAGLYFGGWHPSRIGHHGHLLNPPRQLPEQIPHPKGASFGARSTGKNAEKWKLVLQVRGSCTTDCTSRLDEMRRIHVALYKNMGRLSRAVLTDQPDDPALLALHASQPDLTVLTAPPDALAEITDPVLLVDPQGLVIMTYPPDASPQGMRADLDRLLKYAWTG